MRRLAFRDIPLWEEDDHAAAWAAFAVDAPRLTAKGARMAFGIGFEPVEVTAPEPGRGDILIGAGGEAGAIHIADRMIWLRRRE